MSEKRFKLSSETVLQYQIMNNDTDLNENEVVDLLNENEQLKDLLKEAEDEIENLKKSNKGLMESIVEKDEQINKLKKEVDEYKEAIINKVQYYEDIEDFAIKKGLIKKDWAKFDGYD